jgi:hypothetical protein
MLRRFNQVLAGVLVVQIVLSVVVFWPRSAATGASEPVFPELSSADVATLAIADADGNSITLRQVIGEWVLPDADDFPADADKVTTFLGKVLSLNTGRLVTRTDASHKRLQVSPTDYLRRIGLEVADGEKYTIYLGSSPSYGATHFRLDGQNETYLTGEITSWEAAARASSWIDTSYLSIPEEDIVGVRLQNAQGELSFVKGEDDAWTMAEVAEGDEVGPTKIASVVRRAASIVMTAPLGKTALPEYGMDAPSAVVTIATADKSVTLRVGAKSADDNSYVVISSESPYHVRVSEYTAKDLVEKGYDDFLMAEPEAPPASE